MVIEGFEGKFGMKKARGVGLRNEGKVAILKVDTIQSWSIREWTKMAIHHTQKL
jgi:hypothetical protein